MFFIPNLHFTNCYAEEVSYMISQYNNFSSSIFKYAGGWNYQILWDWFGADSGWLNLVSLPASDCFAIKFHIIFHATIILTIARLKSVKANGGVFLLYSWEFNINNLRVMKSNTFDILLKVFIDHKNECTKFLHTLFNRWMMLVDNLLL